MKTITYLSLCLLFVFSACQFNNTAVTVDYAGVYKGTLPCADCGGIESKLTLNKDQRFIYERTYIGKDGRFTDTGRYTVNEKILTIQENNTPVHFFIGERDLLFLNNDLKPAQGVLAPYYTLKKQGKFTYPGRYETFSEGEGAYKQILFISPKGKEYQVEFSASKVGGVENCHFSGTAWLENGTLWANISTDETQEILMYIVPTHDNLGVDVFTPDFEDRFHLMRYCRGGASLSGEYIKNTITADSVGVFNTSTTIEDVLQTLPLTQVNKKHDTGEFADDVYDDYEVCTRHNQHLFTLTPRVTGDIRQKIDRVFIKSPFFKTAKGIHMNSTYQDIKNAYTITEIMPDIKHIVLVVDEINASFSIPKTALQEGWWDNITKTVNRDKIPCTAQIDSFILWWNR
ncbi:MAG: hypothetical protein CSA25_06920 [Desulfobacter postgatei]|uniref:Copper homeostasis protein n=1 Tax=Desulfobacter postgatei TaxID=2293 RepID=A0A2G6MPS7_9BACT|nr:MAG: hypothetical protein CSA25_06920 [Desulfobacter postgatei]